MATTRARRRKLTEAQKRFVIKRLACFEAVKDVVAALKAEHGVSLSSASIQYYDPTKAHNTALAQDHQALFDATRALFCAQVNAIPVANKVVRVKKLAKAVDAYERAGEYREMADMLERIAKEMGDVHTNRRELTGRAGGPIQVQEMSMEQVDRELALIMAEAGLELESDTSSDALH